MMMDGKAITRTVTSKTTMMTDVSARDIARAKARQAAAQRKEREMRWRRLLVIGAIASFATFTGVIVSQEGLSAGNPNQSELGAPAGGQIRTVIVPRVRTRSS